MPEVTYGLSEGCQVRAVDVAATGQGIAFTLRSPWGDALVRAPLLGRFNVYNALAAAATCLVAGLSPGEDYLALSADKALGEPDDYLSAMHAVAGERRERKADVGPQVVIECDREGEGLPAPSRRDLCRQFLGTNDPERPP